MTAVIEEILGTHVFGNGMPQSLDMKRFVGPDLSAARTRLISGPPDSGPMTGIVEITVWMLSFSRTRVSSSTSS